MNVLMVEMKRAFGSRRFLAGAAAFAAAALLGVWRPVTEAFTVPQMSDPGHTLRTAAEALRSQYLLLILPAAACLPYAASFAEDAKSRFLRSYLPRCGRKPYLAAHTAAAAASGAGAAGAGIAFMLAVLSLVLLPAELRPDPLTLSETQAEKMAAGTEVFLLTVRIMLSASFWALTGAAAAAISMNGYLAIAVPFIAYYLLVILSTRYFPEAGALDPQKWADGTGIWQDAPALAALLVLELLAAAGFLLMLLMDRRLKDV